MTAQAAPRFTLADADRAHEEWGCNCGPASLAAICKLTLDEVRPHLGDFETKRYTNQTLMHFALNSIGVKWRKIDHREVLEYPFYGLCLVQWEGPWSDPGVHPLAKYRYTHWIGVWRSIDVASNGIGIFDVNCLNNGQGWGSLDNWSKIMVPHLTAQYKSANGKWHIMHAIEVER